MSPVEAQELVASQLATIQNSNSSGLAEQMQAFASQISALQTYEQWCKQWQPAFQSGSSLTPQGDPDGPLVPLPDSKAKNPVPYSTPAHDYIAALYRPYVAPF